MSHAAQLASRTYCQFFRRRNYRTVGSRTLYRRYYGAM